MNNDTAMLEEQMRFMPKIEGEFAEAPVYVCGGMGGSALPALAARMLGAAPYVIMHRDYGLPSAMPAGAACIAISYSGDTEETLSFAQEAHQNGLPLSILTTGGKLLSFANEFSIPYLLVPTGLQPRDAVLYMTKALLMLMRQDALVAELSQPSFDTDAAERDADGLIAELEGTTPVFYSSLRNEALSYIAKIQCNETAKVPAFSNVFPEMNHNELQGFGTGDGARALTQPLVAVFLRDTTDHERVQRRMHLTKELVEGEGMHTAEVTLPSGSRAQTFLYAWWMMRATARGLAARYGVDPDATPLIASFKQSL